MSHWWAIKSFCNFISIRGLNGAKIQKFLTFERYTELLLFIQFWCIFLEMIVLRTFSTICGWISYIFYGFRDKLEKKNCQWEKLGVIKHSQGKYNNKKYQWIPFDVSMQITSCVYANILNIIKCYCYTRLPYLNNRDMQVSWDSSQWHILAMNNVSGRTIITHM